MVVSSIADAGTASSGGDQPKVLCRLKATSILNEDLGSRHAREDRSAEARSHSRGPGVDGLSGRLGGAEMGRWRCGRGPGCRSWRARCFGTGPTGAPAPNAIDRRFAATLAGKRSGLIEGGQARWQAIEPCRIAILDLGFAMRVPVSRDSNGDRCPRGSSLAAPCREHGHRPAAEGRDARADDARFSPIATERLGRTARGSRSI